jgi:Zn-dependent protease with chaperone function
MSRIPLAGARGSGARAGAWLALIALPLFAQLKEYKPGFNLFSVEQDIQLGKEAAAEVERSMPVVTNAELNGYLNRIGARLAKSRRAGPFPYRFTAINDKSINAFALPGGAMYVHTGLIAAAENESQIAGVLAHEISHVALRHGTSQASKANLIQLPAMLAAGRLGQGGILGSLGRLGIGIGTQSVLLKYSRNAERDADLHGAQIMHDSGYDPVQMARFFETLEAHGQRDNSALANWFADHPTPGRRVESVQDQNKYLPKVQYNEYEPEALSRMKQLVASLAAPQRPRLAGAQGREAQLPGQARPSGRYRQFQSQSYRLNYPDNWEVFGSQDSPMVTIAPRGAVLEDAGGQTHIGYGLIASYYLTDAAYVDVDRETSNLIRQFERGATGLRRGRDPQRAIRVAGQRALLTPMESPSPYPGETEVDTLVTLERPEGLFYLLFIAPRSEWGQAARDFNNILESVQFRTR